MQSAEQPKILKSFADGWAVYKPSGFLTRPETRAPGVPSVLEWARQTCSPAAHLVHRIDRETSGVLILAASATASTRWAQLFEKHLIQKIYFTLAWGAPTLPIFKVDLPLDEKKAVTQVRLLARGTHAGRAAFAARVQIMTGRTHQIRRHLSMRGFPLWNDPRYGGVPGPEFLGRAALHAWALEIPELGQVHCPLPQDLLATLEHLARVAGWSLPPQLLQNQEVR